MEKEQVNNLNDIIDDLIHSYESRIKNIESVFFKSEAIVQSSFDLLQEFNNSLKEYKKERACVNSQLQESLAKKVSLRKKDYNLMMSDILNKLDEKELEVEKCFSQFIEEQKFMNQFLKTGVLEIKDGLQNGEHKDINLFRESLSRITIELETKKNLVINQLNNYRDMHRKTIEKLKELLAKGDQIYVSDVKEIHHELLTEIL